MRSCLQFSIYAPYIEPIKNSGKKDNEKIIMPKKAPMMLCL